MKKCRVFVRGLWRAVISVCERFYNLIITFGNSAADSKYEGPYAEGKFEVDRWLPEMPDGMPMLGKDYRKEKIKVRFLCAKHIFWNTMETVCRSFERDPKYDVLVLVSDTFYQETAGLIKELGHNYIAEREWEAEADQPDILLLDFNQVDAPNIQKHLYYFKLIVAVTAELIVYRYGSNVENILRGYQSCSPDFYFVDSLLYKRALDEGIVDRLHLVEMGNAKYDGIYEGTRQRQYPDGLEKIKGKKTVVWASGHGIYVGRISYMCSFDLYAKAIFDYAKANTDLGIIVRASPTFVEEMLEYGFWSMEDLRRIKYYCKLSPNIIWDDEATYNTSFGIADAVLTDGYCGIIASALPLLKPICVCYRYDVKIQPVHPELVSNYYQAHSVQEVTDFFDMVRRGKDPMFEQRKEAARKYVKHFDGQNGQRQKEYIENAFMEKLNIKL